VIKSRLGSDFDQIVHRVFPFVKRIKLQPNTLTLYGVAVSALAGAAFATDRLPAAAFLMTLAGFFDLIDGVVAREQGSMSRAGAFFDSSMDRLSDLLIFGGIAVAAAVRVDVAAVLLVMWALSGAVMTSYVRARAEVVLESLSVGIMERGERFVVLILGAASGYLEPALWIVAIGATITAVQRLVVAHREIAALPEEEPEELPEDEDEVRRGPRPLEEVS
jgi:phosphatidylglycerophosphate synthase